LDGSDNIKMGVKEQGCVPDWGRLRAVVKMAMNMYMVHNKYSHCFSKQQEYAYIIM